MKLINKCLMEIIGRNLVKLSLMALLENHQSLSKKTCEISHHQIMVDDLVIVTIFTLFSLIYLLSSKCPNTRSNHDMVLSYLILSYLIFSHFKVTPSRRGKQIALEYRQRTIYSEEGATTHAFSLSDSPNPSKSNSSSASSPPCSQVLS